jgi:protease I
MKKTVMIIAEKQFREEELFQPKEILEKAGIEIKVASTTTGLATGVEGQTYKPQLLVKDIVVSDFDAVVFVGGGGATQYWDDPVAHKIARQAQEAGKVLGAICVAPVILAKAGILKGKHATVWSSDSGQLLVAGAKYSRADVEIDGNIITAAGPFASREFGQALVKAIIN